MLGFSNYIPKCLAFLIIFQNVWFFQLYSKMLGFSNYIPKCLVFPIEIVKTLTIHTNLVTRNYNETNNEISGTTLHLK